MWLLSYMFAMEFIWDNEGKYIKLLCIWIMPTAIIIHEFCQLMRLVNGTWDINDLTIYIIAIAIYQCAILEFRVQVFQIINSPFPEALFR